MIVEYARDRQRVRLRLASVFNESRLNIANSEAKIRFL